MKYQIAKQKAIILRRQGRTYKEIIATVGGGIPKSTISNWCKKIKLDYKTKNKIRSQNLLLLKLARKKALRVNKEKRDKNLNNIFHKNERLASLLNNKKISLLALACLYLAEGGKKQKGALMFGNSDPRIIKLFLKLLRFVYLIDESKFRCTLQGRYGQNISELEKFWANITNIPLSQFYQARIDNRTKGKKIRKLNYKGVCRIDYFSAAIFHELNIIGKILTE